MTKISRAFARKLSPRGRKVRLQSCDCKRDSLLIRADSTRRTHSSLNSSTLFSQRSRGTSLLSSPPTSNERITGSVEREYVESDRKSCSRNSVLRVSRHCIIFRRCSVDESPIELTYTDRAAMDRSQIPIDISNLAARQHAQPALAPLLRVLHRVYVRSRGNFWGVAGVAANHVRENCSSREASEHNSIVSRRSRRWQRRD